jgi:hypothetical protein
MHSIRITKYGISLIKASEETTKETVVDTSEPCPLEDL